jgi:predicted SprT family Zn-dependent metalloprotease
VVCGCRQRARRWTRHVESRAELRYVCTWCDKLLDVNGKVVSRQEKE